MKFKSLLLLLLVFLTACSMQRQPVPPGTIPAQSNVNRADKVYGQQVLNELSKQYPVNYNVAYNRRVNSLVERLARAANADQNPWYVYVLEGDDVLNAAATRGNHVFVWTGMLKFARSDDELAAVVGHELSHVLAGHTEPTSMEQVNQILVGITGQAVGSQAGGLGGQLASTLAQAILINPGSQRVELEADQIGVFIMARAGYDPRAAITLWTKMKDQEDASGGVLAFMSTHPPSDERISQLEILMPQALADYKKSGRASAGSNSVYLPTYPTSPVPKAPQARQPILSARVVPDRSPVFSRPSTESQPTDILQRGNRVRILKELPQWVEIDRPTSGFMRKRDLRPE